MTVSEGGGSRILVIDDDRVCCQLIADVLRDAGHEVRLLSDARQAVATAAAWRPGIVMLDVIMPFVDGISVCLALRERIECGIVIVSAKGDASDRAVGLRLGADDYITKPFDTTELEARVAALVRRRRGRADRTERRVGTLCLHRAQKRATVAGQVLPLTATEFRLLDLMIDDLGRVFTRDELLREVWGGRLASPTRAVDVQVGRLRRKLQRSGVRGLSVHARRGFGYVAVGESGIEIPLLSPEALSAA